MLYICKKISNKTKKDYFGVFYVDSQGKETCLTFDKIIMCRLLGIVFWSDLEKILADSNYRYKLD